MGPIRILEELAERVEQRYGPAMAATDWETELAAEGGLPLQALPREARVLTLIAPVAIIGLASAVGQLIDRIEALEQTRRLVLKLGGPRVMFGDEPPAGCG